MKILFVGILAILKICVLNAQESKATIDSATLNLPQNENLINSPPLADESGSKVGFFTSFEITLSISILVFGVIILILQVILIKSANIKSDKALKLNLVSLIIVATIFLITAGYSNDQIAPATGLLGAIAGYLLGSKGDKTGNDE